MLFENPTISEMRFLKLQVGNIPDSVIGIDWKKYYEYYIPPKAENERQKLDITVRITSKNILPAIDINIQYSHLITPLKRDLTPLLENDFIQYGKLILQMEYDIQTNVFDKHPVLCKFKIHDSLEATVRRMKLGFSLGNN